MNMPRKNNLIILSLLFATTLNIYTMNPKPKPSKKEVVAKWANIAGHIMLGEIPLQRLLIPATVETHTSDSFMSLSQDMQKQIIILLTSYNGANALEDAIKSIQSLSLVSKDLQSLINEPQFCLRIIKELSVRFQMPNQIVCTMLPITGAKNRLHLQEELFHLCLEKEPSQEKFEVLCKKNVDLEFTYEYHDKSNKRSRIFIVTPLMLATVLPEQVMINYILGKNISINGSNGFGLNPLLFAAKINNANALTILCPIKNINLNQQNELGQTALAIVLNDALKNAVFSLKDQTLLCIKTLILAGASLDTADNHGLTPRMLIKEINNKQINSFVEQITQKK